MCINYRLKLSKLPFEIQKCDIIGYLIDVGHEKLVITDYHYQEKKIPCASLLHSHSNQCILSVCLGLRLGFTDGHINVD